MRFPETSPESQLQCYAVIPAAGRGLRMGASQEKQFLQFFERPLLAGTLAIFESCPLINGVVVVTPADRIEYCRRHVIAPFNLNKVCAVVPGGPQRQQSVFLGLQAVPFDVDFVAVHDGVRPLLDVSLLERVIRAARIRGAAIPTLPLNETVKRSLDQETISDTLDRTTLYLAQTPQVFRREILWEAHRNAREHKFHGTDDSMLVERLGYSVHMVPGAPENIKITTVEDLRLAELLHAATRKTH